MAPGWCLVLESSLPSGASRLNDLSAPAFNTPFPTSQTVPKTKIKQHNQSSEQSMLRYLDVKYTTLSLALSIAELLRDSSVSAHLCRWVYNLAKGWLGYDCTLDCSTARVNAKDTLSAMPTTATAQSRMAWTCVRDVTHQLQATGCCVLANSRHHMRIVGTIA